MERKIRNINIGVYEDQLEILEGIRKKSNRSYVPSRSELVREAIDNFIELCSQPNLISSGAKLVKE